MPTEIFLCVPNRVREEYCTWSSYAQSRQLIIWRVNLFSVDLKLFQIFQYNSYCYSTVSNICC